MGEVKINRREYEKLLRSQRKLQALESGGVDSWEWYSESLKDFHEEERFDELLQEYTDAILEECSLGADVEYPAGREAGHNVLFSDDVENTIKSLLRKFYTSIKNSENN